MSKQIIQNQELDEISIADLTAPIKWAQCLSPNDKLQLEKLLSLKAIDFIRALTQYQLFGPIEQQAVAKEAGCHPGTISRILGGTNPSPSEDITRNIRHYAIFDNSLEDS